MSNAIRYDALLVRDLAAELHARLAGCRLDEARVDRKSLRVALRTRAARRADAPPPSLIWHLHPEDGRLHRLDTLPPGGQVQLATPTIITRITAPPDERIITIDLDARDAPSGMARCIIIELVTNQWNAVVLGAEERIAAVLRERSTGDRELRAGVAYLPPPRSARAGRTEPLGRDTWRELLLSAPAGTRMAALVRDVAWTSPLNAAHILGAADTTDSPAELDRAYDRYTELVWNGSAEPVITHVDGRAQPYSRAIGDSPERVGSLLAALERAAAPDDAGGNIDRALDIVALRIEAAGRRIERLRAQQQGAAEEAERVRRNADLLLAQLYRVERGATRVELDDFAGGTLTVELDSALGAAENAQRMYAAARRRARAAERIPSLIDDAQREIAQLERFAGRIREGSVAAEDLAALKAPPRSAASGDAPSLPYREYRTTRGLEVRVGRGSRANDALTFRHSSPTDIWLHARDVAGAHVILRWPRSDENPPAADIAEAANLAALFSRARTSGLVAVDWTRRKWVRKPRKAAPGLVIPERVKTVFVEPDAALEERLRADALL